MANTGSVTKEDWGTRLLVPIGLMVVMAAAVAAIVAGVLTSDVFGGGLSVTQLARDHGVASSIGAWSMPLALTGIATLFSGIVVALARIRINIRSRRDAFASALPRILGTNH